MLRQEVWWAELPPPSGSGPGHRRPVLIVQANAFNRSAIQTVVVCAITSNVRLAEAPGNVSLTPKQSGLPKPSVVNVSQVLTLDRALLTERVGRIPAAKMRAISDGLQLVLGLATISGA